MHRWWNLSNLIWILRNYSSDVDKLIRNKLASQISIHSKLIISNFQNINFDWFSNLLKGHSFHSKTSNEVPANEEIKDFDECFKFRYQYSRDAPVEMVLVPAVADPVSFEAVLRVVWAGFAVWAIGRGLMMPRRFRWLRRRARRQRRSSSCTSMEVGQRLVANGGLHWRRTDGFPTSPSWGVRVRVASTEFEARIWLQAML